MSTPTEIFDKLCAFARECDGVRAMLLFGSRARDERPADEYSDFDLLLFVDDVDKFAYTDEWLDSIEKPKISFVEPTAVQNVERRVFFENALDTDLILYDARDFEKIITHEIIRAWLSRGYRVLVDKIGVTPLIEPQKMTKPIPTQAEFDNLANIFWFHTIWSLKKLLRGEIWAAKACIDSDLKLYLSEMLEWRAIEKDTWHSGRFFDSWAGADVVSALDKAYGAYNVPSLLDALLSTMRLFSEAQRGAAAKLGLKNADAAEAYASHIVDKLSENRTLAPMPPHRAIAKMIDMSNGNLREIGHFMKVYAFARAIAEGERADTETLRRAEIAAVIHDIAVPVCRKKYGDASGKLQEAESRPLVEAFLADSGYSDEFIERVAFVVSHHHTYGVGGLDHQILIEADYLVNAEEGRVARENVATALDKVFRTPTGRRLVKEMYRL